MLAQWHDIHLQFPDKYVLRGVSLTIHPGDRIGLVGENGSGKTCLFRILLGQMQPSTGAVYLARDVRIGYLTQHLLDMANTYAKRTCWDAACEPFAHLAALEQELESIVRALSGENVESVRTDDAEALLARLGDLQQRFEIGGGYTYRVRVEETLRGLGLAPHLWEQPLTTLSAGQKVRLALARLLLGEHDVLLLDEPTNHLDIEAREWLQNHLRNIDTAYVVVSHDRVFLDAVIDKVAHLHDGLVKVYSGNYSEFRARLEVETTRAWEKYEQRRKLVRKLERQARKYETWSHRTEKKKQGTFDKGFVGKRAAKLMNRSIQARRRIEETIEKLQTEKPSKPTRVAMDFHASEGRFLVAVTDVAVGYDRSHPLAEGISFEVEAGDRIAIVGPNGSGKSTLLKTVLGHLAPLAGDVWRSETADIGYFDQDARGLPFEATALEAVKEAHPDDTLIRTVMARMRIVNDSVFKPVRRLSAGERAKVLLAKLMVGAHNLLVLDEPTNHLDLATQDVLLETLSEFPGAILFVSHDRHFVQELATDVISM